MRTPIVLPELGAAPVRLTVWFSKPGDIVFEGDRLVEVAVAGATFDVSAPATGRLIEHHAWPRDLLSAGQVLGVMESSEESEE
ncbi:MAG TPA: biotin/lipoyl-containing protein [Gemmataceae bacterium]|jgi:pyruvate/2-oxoglutarate dehydrogenase complex dihydrolipoamide acyltransferase (E2) component